MHGRVENYESCDRGCVEWNKMFKVEGKHILSGHDPTIWIMGHKSSGGDRRWDKNEMDRAVGRRDWGIGE